jgi:Protein of unknown function (DUF3631)
LALPPAALEAMALWVCFAHTFQAHTVSPRLCLLSPVPECGKTTALTLLGHLCPNSLLLSNISPAAVYRYIEQVKDDYQPTLLLDEGGTYLEGSVAFLGILNSGHTKLGAKVMRVGGKDQSFRVEEFSTWTPIAIAKIGKLPSEWASRSLVVQMRRKRPDEYKDRLRERDVVELDALCQRVAQWAPEIINELSDPDPLIPEQLANRAADNWRPLFAIADVAGGDWPARARNAAVTLSECSDVSAPEAVLAAVFVAFKHAKTDRLSSERLCKMLGSGDDEQFNNITQTRLSRQLKPFGITPRSIRVQNQVLRGYLLEQFEDAFARYLRPAMKSATGGIPVIATKYVR